MKAALEALEMLAKWEHPASNITTKSGRIYPHHVAKNSAATLRLAIEQAEKQEPVAQCSYPRCQTSAGCGGACSKTFYTAPPQQEKQEPVAYVSGYYAGRCVIEPLNRAMVMPDGMALYTTPPQRQPHELLCVCGASWSIDSEGNEELLSTPPQRQPLTNETLWEMWVESPSDVLQFARAIERKHGIGGGE